MHDEIENLIDEAGQQSDLINAFTSNHPNSWIVECLEQQLYMLIEALPDQEALLFTTLIEVPADDEPPLASLMNFNAIVEQTDGIFTGLEPDGALISARRLITLRNLSSGDIISTIEVLSQKTLVLHAIVGNGEAKADRTGAAKDAEQAQTPSTTEPLDSNDFMVFRG